MSSSGRFEAQNNPGCEEAVVLVWHCGNIVSCEPEAYCPRNFQRYSAETHHKIITASRTDGAVGVVYITPLVGW